MIISSSDLGRGRSRRKWKITCPASGSPQNWSREKREGEACRIQSDFAIAPLLGRPFSRGSSFFSETGQLNRFFLSPLFRGKASRFSERSRRSKDFEVKFSLFSPRSSSRIKREANSIDFGKDPLQAAIIKGLLFPTAGGCGTKRVKPKKNHLFTLLPR